MSATIPLIFVSRRFTFDSIAKVNSNSHFNCVVKRRKKRETWFSIEKANGRLLLGGRDFRVKLSNWLSVVPLPHFIKCKCGKSVVHESVRNMNLHDGQHNQCGLQSFIVPLNNSTVEEKSSREGSGKWRRVHRQFLSIFHSIFRCPFIYIMEDKQSNGAIKRFQSSLCFKFISNWNGLVIHRRCVCVSLLYNIMHNIKYMQMKQCCYKFIWLLRLMSFVGTIKQK